MNKRTTIIFGGTFDPVHIGHISLAREVLLRGMAEEVWFMVSPCNPHKQQLQLSDEAVRLEMVRLAVEGEEGMLPCDFEFSLPRPSYTFNTLLALEQKYPEREFMLLIGADNWEKFPAWYKSEEILARCRLVVYPRGNETKPLLPNGVEWLPARLYDVSSTMVRDAVAEGRDISGFVAPAVEEYIRTNKLYKK